MVSRTLVYTYNSIGTTLGPATWRPGRDAGNRSGAERCWPPRRLIHRFALVVRTGRTGAPRPGRARSRRPPARFAETRLRRSFCERYSAALRTRRRPPVGRPRRGGHLVAGPCCRSALRPEGLHAAGGQDTARNLDRPLHLWFCGTSKDCF